MSLKRRRLALGLALVASLGTLGGAAYVWALRTLAIPWRTVATGSPVKSLAFSPSGELVAAMGEDATVRVFAASDGHPVMSFAAGREKGVSLAFLPDGEKLVTTAESSLKLWAWREGKCLRTFPEHPSEMHALAVSRDGQWIAATSSDDRVRVWTSEGYLILVSERSEFGRSAFFDSSFSVRLRCLAFSRDSEQVVVGHHEGVSAIKVENLARVEPFREHEQEAELGPLEARAGTGVLALATSPSSDLVVEGGLRRAFTWSEARGKQLDLEGADQIGLCSVAYTSDGDSIVGADPFGRVRVWESATGKLVAQSRPLSPLDPHELETRVPWPTVVAVSPKGERIASGDGEGTLKLWWMPR